MCVVRFCRHLCVCARMRGASWLVESNTDAFVQIFVGLVRKSKYVDDDRVAIVRVRRMPRGTLMYTGTVILKQHIWGLLIGSQRQSRMLRPIHMYFYMCVMFGRSRFLFVSIMTQFGTI